MGDERPVLLSPVVPGRRERVGELDLTILRTEGPARAIRPPAVLVHGIGMSHRYFARLHALLAEHAPVVSVDLPGFGETPTPRADVDIAVMAHALGEVIAREGLPPVVLVGHSMGAQWVVELALQRPDLVAHVVVIGPVTDAGHRTLPAQMTALGLDTLRETLSVNAIVFTDYLRCGPRWYLTQVRHMLAYPIEDRVAQLTAPLLVMRGSRDPIAGLEWCRTLRDRAAVARVVQIPGAAHVAQHTAGRAVDSAIRALT